ncbi:hypothetical protein HY415_01925 [Candidatus Kaiserbacteria bacterium]|nr:hypothetical protein [Candidatus Kaiserbacteria bacterium]
MPESITEPFVKQDLYETSAYIARDTFTTLILKLDQLGFRKQTVVLPADEDKKNTTAPKPSRTLTINEFLERDQDYDGTVVRFLNEENRDEIVILFRNRPIALSFTDNIFPRAAGELKSNLYVSTQDPVRTYGLVTYLKDLFKNEIRSPGLEKLLFSINIIAVGSAVAIHSTDLLKNQVLSTALAIGIPVLIFIATNRFFPEKGLRVSRVKRVKQYPPYIEKLRENWLLVLVTAILSVIGTLSVLYISNYFELKS